MEEGWWRSVVVNVRQQHVCQLRTFFHLEQISVLNNFGTVRKAKIIKYDIDEGLNLKALGM
ncbi:hypothetical protein MtrunA17_Chr5g0443971 [Medicago truncatula]|uniref:Uncharacterized protein n=1 Tax=Medicago truncatula TaxID=3880 RepID=A0A396HWN8_MEDTR|nr:hypothetical protein MtrunA17_Chr5g0443971 [Medicago truncatula]